MPSVLKGQFQILYSKHGHHNMSHPIWPSRALLSPILYQEVQSMSLLPEPEQGFATALTCKVWQVWEKWPWVTSRQAHEREYSFCLALFLLCLPWELNHHAVRKLRPHRCPHEKGLRLSLQLMASSQVNEWSWKQLLQPFVEPCPLIPGMAAMSLLHRPLIKWQSCEQNKWLLLLLSTLIWRSNRVR